MCCHASHGRLRGKVSRAAVGLIEDGSAGLRELLPAQVVQGAVEAEVVRFRECLFTPLVTLWTFLTQVLSADGSCRAAVAKLLALLSAGVDDVDEVDANTGPYCKARQRLPEGLVRRLACQTGRQLHERYPSGRLLGGRKVRVVDGTFCSMPDTPANQARWPQPPTQKPGLGFPLVRLVAVLSLNCAAVMDVAFGPYKGKQSGESALFRTLLGNLERGDVLLADRYYASYWMIALLTGRGVDVLFRQHQLRKVDFRSGQRLGDEDHVITMHKPPQRPDWMDATAYERMPETLTVRELRLTVSQCGFRVRSLILVTTLLDAQQYNKQELAEAFRCRWHVELDLRAIKQTMKMSVLRCKSPAMVLKEIWIHLLAYNLVRTLMARAASEAGVEPRQLSFAGAVQAVNAFAPALQLAEPTEQDKLLRILLRVIARDRVGDRPDRYEPRAVKRRSKPIAMLSVPRDQMRKRLATSGAANG
jgi:Transposase DDE domain